MSTRVASEREAHLVYVGRRNDHDGIDTHLLEYIRHLTYTTRFVCHDMSTELLEILAFGRVQSKACHGVEVLLEVVVGQEELSNEVSGLTVGSGDANVSLRHRWRLAVVGDERSEVRAGHLRGYW